jgi:hypothetical protein
MAATQNHGHSQLGFYRRFCAASCHDVQKNLYKCQFFLLGRLQVYGNYHYSVCVMGLVLKVKSSALIEEPLIVVHLICMCTHTVFITTGVTIIVQFMKPMFGSIKLCHFFMSATPEISKKQYLDRFVYFQHPFSTIGLFHLRGSQCFNT